MKQQHTQHGAEHKRENHTAQSDNGSDYGITEEHPQIRFQTRHEQQHDRAEGRDGIQRHGNRKRSSFQQREETMFKSRQTEIHPSQQVGSDQDTCQEFAQYRRDADSLSQPAKKFGGKDNQSELNRQQGDLTCHRHFLLQSLL